MRVALDKRIKTGVLNGFEVWMSYGVVEYCFGQLGPLLLHQDNGVMTLPQWRGMVYLLCVYSLIGMIVGGVSGVLLSGDDPLERRSRKVLLLSLVGFYGIHASHALSPRAVAELCAVILIALAVFRDIGSTPSRLGICGQPWAVSAALIPSSMAAYGLQLSWPLLTLAPAAVALAVLASYLGILLLHDWLARRLHVYPYLADAIKVAAIAGLTLAPNLLSGQSIVGDPNARPPVIATGRPNILLVTLDTVRADHMGLYGYQRANTPNLEEVARHATVYSRFTAAAPVTLTSHASIFTGLYPQSHGAYHVYPDFQRGRPLPKSIPTVASILSAAGYRTQAVMANRYYLRPEFGLLRGFQYFSQPDPAILVFEKSYYLLRCPIRRHLLRFDGVLQDLDAKTVDGQEINRQAFELLRKAAAGQSPFFLFLNYLDAHVPYVPPAPYSQMYSGRDTSILGSDYLPLDIPVNRDGETISPHLLAHMVSQYDGAIAALDAYMGKLISELKKLGLYDNTLIIITSDHGEAFGEKGYIMHDWSVDQSLIHVPLIVKYPHQTAPDRVDALASQVDLMPTMLEIAGLKVPARVEGISLLQARNQPDRTIVAEYHNNSPHPSNRLERDDYALFSGTTKIVFSTNGSRSLYDLAVDPHEEHNLYRAGEPLAADLRGRLEQWSRATVPLFNSSQAPDAKTVKALESLGYAR